MIEIQEIFKYKIPNRDKLTKYGFTGRTAPEGQDTSKQEHQVKGNVTFAKEKSILKNQFKMSVEISIEADKPFAIRYKVIETELDEEYALVHVESAVGGFVAEVREACEKVLVEIAEKCFDTEILKAEQTRRTLAFIEDTYGVKPEFLWEKSADSAAIRRTDNQKWFAAIMTIDRHKLGLAGHGNVEIMDLKDTPEHIEARLDGEKFFPGFHMNKKHWYTICLDGSVCDEELFQLIVTSYEIVK